MTHLKKVSEQKPQATYYNVDMLKYQVGCFFGEIKLCQKKKKRQNYSCKKWCFPSAECEVGAHCPTVPSVLGCLALSPALNSVGIPGLAPKCDIGVCGIDTGKGREKWDFSLRPYGN